MEAPNLEWVISHCGAPLTGHLGKVTAARRELSALVSALEGGRHEAFLQGLREAASIAATRGGDVLPASEIYEAIMARVRFEENPP